MQEWKRYIETLFTDNRSVSHYITVHDGIDITKVELLRAMLVVKNGKAAGPDGIQMEVLKTLVGDHTSVKLTRLYISNRNYPQRLAQINFCCNTKKGQ